jgi:hypothetical protein
MEDNTHQFDKDERGSLKKTLLLSRFRLNLILDLSNSGFTNKQTMNRLNDRGIRAARNKAYLQKLV